MIIQKVILVCNDNPLYYKFAKDVYDLWEKRIKIPPHIFIVSDKKLKIKFGHRLVQYIKPIPNIPTAFQSQVIRLLLPCLYKDENVIITDIDMLPIQKKMFKKVIKHLNDDYFIQYFHYNQICYNCAKGSVWNEIFNVNSIKDIRPLIKLWFKEYKGAHTTDQQILTKYINQYNKPKIILTSYLPSNTVIKRLSVYSKPDLVSTIKLEELHEYLDFHIHHIFNDSKNIKYYKKIIKYLLTNK